MIRLLSLFSGIGAYEKALKNLRVNFELVNYCELNEQISNCYSLIHKVDKSKNLVDIKTIDIDKLPDFDLLTYSPPCQDISTIGQHAGINKNTRTGLMWDAISVIARKKPKYLVMENVRNLKNKYGDIFKEYVQTIEKLGYKCYSDILNAKDYGIPQNRQRLFMIGIRSDLNIKFEMPKKQELKKTLRDYLDIDEVVNAINKDIAYTIRVGGRKSKVGNKHNWDGYLVNGKEYYLNARECLRLMGFDSSDYGILKNAGISSSAVYKVAGNSVVVSVMEHIFKNMKL